MKKLILLAAAVVALIFAVTGTARPQANGLVDGRAHWSDGSLAANAGVYINHWHGNCPDYTTHTDRYGHFPFDGAAKFIQAGCDYGLYAAKVAGCWLWSSYPYVYTGYVYPGSQWEADLYMTNVQPICGSPSSGP